MEVINLPWYVIKEDKDENGQTKKIVVNYPWYIQPPLETDSQYQDMISPYTQWSLSQPYGLWLFLRILGLVITGIAVSQGSSFWYDIIRQIKGEQKKSDTATTESGSSIIEETRSDQIRLKAIPPSEEPPAPPDEKPAK
jgi:hypothetical protein